MYKEANFPINNITAFKAKALSFGQQFSHFTYFTHNNIPYLFGPFPEMLAIGCNEVIPYLPTAPFDELKKAFEAAPGWLVGYFGYDLKNSIENLQSNNHDSLGFPDFYFYRPEHLLFFELNSVRILSSYPENLCHQINSHPSSTSGEDSTGKAPQFKQMMDFEEYLKKVDAIKNHIIEGDIYEMNFCMEYIAENAKIAPWKIYQKLNHLSPMPFSLFGKFGENYVISASPERFLKKEGSQLISQPIKGTARRGTDDKEDEKIKYALRHDEKELAENLMIVDLVRNDLAKSSKPGSVSVKELFGIYTFKQVHQMISTVVSEIREEVHFTEAIKNAFPMGSMTGAPKIKVMELVEHYENSKRGLYSGATGFISPEGNFDFNVIIRSLLYNNKTNTLSFQVGSAITFDSIPEREYEECMLKASAMFNVFADAGCPIN